MENCVLLKVVPHPNLLPSKRAYTPVFDGLCGEKGRTVVAARIAIKAIAF